MRALSLHRARAALVVIAATMLPIGAEARTPRKAASSRGVHGLQLHIAGAFGFGAKTEDKVKVSDGTNKASAKSKSDNLASLGFMLGADYAVLRYLVVGGRFQFMSWNVEGLDDFDIGRSFALDIDAVVKGRYPFANDRAEVYLAIPIGISILIPSGDLEDKQMLAPWGVNVKLDYSTTVNWNMAVLVGIQYLFIPNFGVYLEMGAIIRGITLHGEKSANNQKFERDDEGTQSQFGLNIGMTYAF